MLYYLHMAYEALYTMSIAIVTVKLDAVKVKSLNEGKVEKEIPGAVEDQPKK